MSKRKAYADDGVGPVRFYSPAEPYGVLSNYYVHARPLHYDMSNGTYASAEHLYQSLKYDYDGAPPVNAEHAEAIRTARTPGIAKALATPHATGSALRFPWQKKANSEARLFALRGSKLRPGWVDELIRVREMRSVLRLKFAADAHCRRILLQTGERPLHEASPSDPFWGAGPNGRGPNQLGRLLEEVRAEIRAKNSERAGTK